MVDDLIALSSVAFEAAFTLACGDQLSADVRHVNVSLRLESSCIGKVHYLVVSSISDSQFGALKLKITGLERPMLT